jgi:hypothetical protein
MMIPMKPLAVDPDAMQLIVETMREAHQKPLDCQRVVGYIAIKRVVQQLKDEGVTTIPLTTFEPFTRA